MTYSDELKKVEITVEHLYQDDEKTPRQSTWRIKTFDDYGEPGVRKVAYEWSDVVKFLGTCDFK